MSKLDSLRFRIPSFAPAPKPSASSLKPEPPATACRLTRSQRRRCHDPTGGAVAVGLVSLVLFVTTLRGEDWPQFRGPNCSGVSLSDRKLPTEFSLTDHVAWSTQLGDGIGSPVVAAGRLFVTAMAGDQQFAVFAFDAATGKPLWKQSLPTGKLPRITPPNSHASSTPATDGKRVFVHFSTLGLLAFDAVDGKRLWEFAVPTPAYLMDWGAGGSPIVHQGTVFFNQDDDLAPALYAIDAETGQLRWKVERPEMLAGYSVPVICESDGRADLVVAGTGRLIAYDPATGQQRWTCKSLLRTMMTTPVVRDGVVYSAVQSYGDESRTLKYALLEWLDTNQDGSLSRKEVPREFWARFDRSDRNHDGTLDGGEVDTAFQSADNLVGGGNSIQAVRGGGQGDVTATHLLWNVQKKCPSNLSSPLVFGQQLFVVKRGGLSSSFDPANGRAQWELKRIRNIGEYYGSPVAGDGKIYVAGENGFIVVLAAGPELNILARNDMGEPIHATPAIADGRIFIRTREKLYCIAEESSP